MMDAFEKLLASLPDPKKDEMPPPAMVDDQGAEQAAAERALARSLLRPGPDTEKAVKYVLTGPLGGHWWKDGDRQTNARGYTFYTNKTSDLVGSVGGHHSYCEVKGMSPGNNFDLIRLDGSKEGERSQYEKLAEAHERGDFVMLALGWWMAPAYAVPVVVRQKQRKVQKWTKADLGLEIDLVEWGMFVEVYEALTRRSIRWVDRAKLFPYCRIYKFGNRWRLDDDHWWYRLCSFSSGTASRLEVAPIISATPRVIKDVTSFSGG